MLHRLRKHLAYSYFKYRTGGICSTPPLPCDPAAGCEVHTMLGARDLPMYLLAVKSLLRFGPPVGVVIHSDGTLTSREVNLLRNQLPGARLVDAAEADARARTALGADSFLWRCRGFDVNYRRLIDTELWCNTPKRIIMDSDVLVLRPPQEVIDWVERGDGPFLIGVPPKNAGPTEKDTDLSKVHVQGVFRVKLQEIAAGVGLPAEFLDGTTAGFYGCTNELSLDRVERLVKTCLDLKLPLHHWGSDQCMVIYLLSVTRAVRLNPELYLNFWPEDLPRVAGAHVVHFLGTNRFYKHVYTSEAVKVVRALQAGQAVPARNPA